MFRQSMGRLRSLLGPNQRKLFLLVFLWTCLCLVIFKKTLFAPNTPVAHSNHQLDARSAALLSSGPSTSAKDRNLAALELEGPEFALPDNANSNALYYGLTLTSTDTGASGGSSKSTQTTANIDSSQSHRGLPIDEHKNETQPPISAPPLAGRSTPVSHAYSHPQQQQQVTIAKDKRHMHKLSSDKLSLHTNESPIAGSQCKYNYPNLFDLQFNNIHWQKMTSTASLATPTPTTKAPSFAAIATYYLYNAYYDDRWRGGLPSIRILSMIDRVQPPPTNCLLWSSKLRHKHGPWPLVTRANFVYAWYPKWGNYKDGILQPWIVTCPMPRAYKHLVPDSVTLTQVPSELPASSTSISSASSRGKRSPIGAGVDYNNSNGGSASIAMPPSYSSSSSSSLSMSPDDDNNQMVQQQMHASASSQPTSSSSLDNQASRGTTDPMPEIQYDCKQTLPLTNNLPIFNKKPAKKEKFAVCVKGLDFPHDDVSVRLVEWIEMLNLLGASKIFLYELDVHENISKVLRYYQKRGLVELSPLTLPGDQPNLPEYQHLYLKSRLTAKRQNELIPYNDCLYRNLNSYQYLALLDIDEVIMPLRHRNWFDLMQEVEQSSLAEQNYSRASYNVRNVYFFDDLSGPLGTTSSSSSSSSSPSSSLITDDQQDSPVNDLAGEQKQQVSGVKLNYEPMDEDENEEDSKQINNSNNNSSGAPHESAERGIPHYLHMMSHVYRSKNYTEPGQYVKCFHNTERVVSLHNHFPMNCFGQCTTYSIPVDLAHLQHYRKDCVGPLKQSCKNDFRVFTTRDTTIWKYKQRMIRRTTRVLNHLGLLSNGKVVIDDSSSMTATANKKLIKR